LQWQVHPETMLLVGGSFDLANYTGDERLPSIRQDMGLQFFTAMTATAVPTSLSRFSARLSAEFVCERAGRLSIYGELQ